MSGSEEKWKIIAVEPGRVRADIIRGRLETEGIPVKLRYESAGVIYGLTLDGLGNVEILVPAESLLRARNILDQSYEREELPWKDGKTK